MSDAEKPLRIGVIGMGKMGLLHAGIVSALSDTQLVAIAEKGRLVSRGFTAVKPGLRTFRNYEQMLDEAGVDAVFITTPQHLHVPMALQCAEREIPFFVEKPLGTSSAECEPLVQAVRKAGLVTMVGYMMRYLGTFRKAKEILDSGVLGELQMLQCSMLVSQLFRKGRGWRYEKNLSGGGVTITQGSHMINLLLWYFGDVEQVSAQTLSFYSSEVEDFAQILLRFQTGLIGRFDLAWSVRHHRMWTTEIAVHGERGNLEVTDDAVRLYLDEPLQRYSAGWTILRKPEVWTGAPIDIGGPEYTQQDLDFVRALRTDQPVENDVEAGYRVQQVIDAIYASAGQRGSSIAPGEGA